MDLPEGNGGPLVVVGQFGSRSSNTLKKIVGKEVHDVHGLGGDTRVGLDFLQYFVDIDSVIIQIRAFSKAMTVINSLVNYLSMLYCF